jgi:glyoxylase-like metal-dependent hydrolase (beta-lactamase superfamily II)
MSEAVVSTPLNRFSSVALGYFGSYRVDVLNFGRFALDGGAMFGTVPKVLWQRVIDCDCCNRIPQATNVLLIRDDRHVVLVDCGNGDKWSDKQRDMYAIADTPSIGQLLEPFGLTPQDVTHLCLTHLHFDHVGGATHWQQGSEGSCPILTFPNAHIWVHQGEWEYACHPHARSKASYLPENLNPIKASGQLHLCQGAKTEILPGLFMQVTGGHTPYHQVIILEGNNAALDAQGVIYWGDVLPTRHHVRTSWVMGYDEYPVEVMKVKEALMKEAHEKRWLSVLDHEVDFPVGFAEPSEKGFIWRSLEP